MARGVDIARGDLRLEGEMSMLEVRQIVNREELERCYDLWGTVFPEERWFFQERVDYDRSYRRESTWVALVDGIIASAIQIFPYTARYGAVDLRVGGIGNVATLPAYRHRGLAQLILHQQVTWMAAAGYDLSLLYTGIASFYAQVGWQSLREGERYRLDLERLGHTPEFGFEIRRGDLVADRAILMDIYDGFSRQVTLSHVRTRAYWEDSARWGRRVAPSVWIAERSHQPVGYLLSMRTPTGQDSVLECVYRPDAGDSALLLVREWARAVARSEPIELRLPDGHALISYAQESPQESGAMWRAFNPVRLLQKIVPELNRRWQESGQTNPFSLALAIGESQVAGIGFDDEGIRVEACDASHLAVDAVIFLSAREFLSMILGAMDENSPAAAHAPLGHLFPSKSPFLWRTDHF